MINFQELPKDSPYSTPKSGFYKATITKAEMTSSKNDPTGAEYLLVVLALQNSKNAKVGSVNDRFFDSDKPAMRYKLQRFMTALGLQTLLQFELRDLPKLVLNQQVAVEIENVPDFRDKDKPAEQQRLTAQTRLFGSEIYWPAQEFERLVKDSGQYEAVADDAGMPFTFDAADGKVGDNKY